jgi:hypothetical protein
MHLLRHMSQPRVSCAKIVDELIQISHAFRRSHDSRRANISRTDPDAHMAGVMEMYVYRYGTGSVLSVGGIQLKQAGMLTTVTAGR